MVDRHAALVLGRHVLVGSNAQKHNCRDSVANKDKQVCGHACYARRPVVPRSRPPLRHERICGQQLAEEAGPATDARHDCDRGWDAAALADAVWASPLKKPCCMICACRLRLIFMSSWCYMRHCWSLEGYSVGFECVLGHIGCTSTNKRTRRDLVRKAFSRGTRSHGWILSHWSSKISCFPENCALRDKRSLL